MVDKNQAVIDFLMNCPIIAANPVYFNFTEAEDNNKSIIITANDKALSRPFIDGSIEKRYTFTIIDFKSIVDQALPVVAGYTSENVADMMDVQSIIDWIDEQADLHNYPDFGEKCIIDGMRTATDNPNLNGVDSNMRPKLAKYSIAIIIDYLDTSKQIGS